MNKLIAVVGMTGSGKSVITDYLESYTLEDLAQLRGYQIEYII